MFFFFKQKTAYEMRISDWSSDVCSSDLDIGHELGLLQYVCHNPVCRCSYQLVCDCERWRASGTHTEDRALEPTIIPTWPSARSSRSPPTSAVGQGQCGRWSIRSGGQGSEAPPDRFAFR